MWLAIAVSFSLFLSTTSLDVIEVFPVCSEAERDWCLELNDVFNMGGNITDATIILHAGVHTVSSYQGATLYHLFNVSFIGEESDSVFVTCSDKHGLAFFNATNLYIANITFNNCSLSESHLINFVSYIDNFLERDFYIPYELRVGIFIAQCMNLTMENLMVTNTSGIGMLGINVLGNSSISHSQFIGNVRPKCRSIENIPLQVYRGDRSIYYQIGGGIYLLYQDTKDTSDFGRNLNTSLSIVRSKFIRNAECSYSAYISLNYKYLSPATSIEYVVGGGGGLSIITAQYSYSVSVNVEESNFSENLAVYGSGVQIGMFYNSPFVKIEFTKCNFVNNGYSYAKGGAGVAMFLNLHKRHYSVTRGLHHSCAMCKVISFIDSNFTNNSALSQGGGLLVYSLANHVHSQYNLEMYNNIMTLTRCSFTVNEAKYGSAFYGAQNVVHGLDGLLGIKIENVTIRNNSNGIEMGKVNAQTVNGNYASTVDLRSVNLVLERRSWFIVEKSASSAIYISSSAILMQEGSSMTLRKNQATQGGGILMEGYTPSIVLAGKCTLNFIENKASAKGGAIFFEKTFDELDDLYPLNSGDCFLFGRDIYIKGSQRDDILTAGNKLIFRDNDAPQGSILYGSALVSCPWAPPATPEDKLRKYVNSTDTFVFSDLEIETKRVSSDPKILRIKNDSKQIEAFPGRVSEVYLEVQDIFDNDIEAVLVADYFDSDTNEDLNFGDFIYKPANETSIRLDIPKVESRNLSITLYTESNLVGDVLIIKVKPCPFGFFYNSSGNCQCAYTSIRGVYCNEEDVTITVEGDTWLGCMTENCSNIGELIVQRCKFGYCHSHNVTFSYDNTSNQCKTGSYRAGVLCGKCADGYNITVGSVCDRCDVSNLYTIALIVLDSFFLFFIFLIVGVTIEKEWTSITFFFSTLVFPYAFLSSKATIPLRRVLYLVNYVNRSRVSDICYFFGMTALSRSGLTLLYGIYLVSITLIFALVCHYSSFMSKHFSPAKTIMTLAYLLYVKTFETCFEILAPWPLWSLDRSVFDVRWVLDPNVQYFRDILHVFLAISSLSLFLVYLIPGVIFLLFPTKMYIYFKSFYPFLDIIWAPFKTKYRPWASIRLLFGVLIVIVAKYSWNYIVTLPITVCFIGVFLYIQTTLQPFKSRLANILDNFFLLIVIVMHILALLLYMYEDFQSLYEDSTAVKILVGVGISVLAVVYVIFFITFVWYWKGSIKFLYSKIKNYFWSLSRAHRKPTTFEVVEVPSRISHNTLILDDNFRLDYAGYRESLLED